MYGYIILAIRFENREEMCYSHFAPNARMGRPPFFFRINLCVRICVCVRVFVCSRQGILYFNKMGSVAGDVNRVSICSTVRASVTYLIEIDPKSVNYNWFLTIYIHVVACWLSSCSNGGR